MDATFLRSLGWTSIRIDQLAQDRGFRSELPILNEDTCKKRQEDLQTRMLSTKQSLAECASGVYTGPKGRLYAFFLDLNQDLSKKRQKMISTDQIKTLKETMGRHRIEATDQVVIVSPNKWSPQAKKESFADFECSHLTFFSMDQLWIRVPEHDSQVPHKPVTLELIRRTVGPSIEDHQLPLIVKSDPVVQWFGFPSGSLLCIERPGFLAFRRVVDHS